MSKNYFILTNEESAYIDKYTIEECKVNSLCLMENAARSVFLSMCNLIEDIYNSKIAVFCGKGNNGGDGLALAKFLKLSDIQVEIFITNEPVENTDPAHYYNICKKLNIPIYKIDTFEQIDKIKNKFYEFDIIVDALLGTGIKGSPKGIISTLISIINKLDKIVVSIDIPSGINGSLNTIEWEAVKADLTVCFGGAKPAILFPPTSEFTDKLVISDIGLILDKKNIRERKFLFRENLPVLKERKKYSYKTSNGKLLIIGGSTGYSGAVILSIKSAFKTGVGMVFSIIPHSILNVIENNCIDSINIPVPARTDGTMARQTFEFIKNNLNDYDAILIGPGMRKTKDTVDLVNNVILNSNVPVLIDADGINAVSENVEILNKSKAPIILSPHPGEFVRLTKIEKKELMKNPLKYVEEFTDKYNCTLIYKIPRTIIADKNNTYVNVTGNQLLATAGSGDVLAGLIAGFLAQKYKITTSAKLGVYLHGYIADYIKHKYGINHFVNSSQLVEYIPIALEHYRNFETKTNIKRVELDL